MHDEETAKKRKEVHDRNLGIFSPRGDGFGAPRATRAEPGMNLKYGIQLKDGNISCVELQHLPIFLLSLDQVRLNSALANFNNSSKVSDYENQLFRYFLTSLSEQIQRLKLGQNEYSALPEEMRKRIGSLEAFLKESSTRL